MTQKDKIVRQYGPLVWQLVYRLAGGARYEADARDCFQEVFVAALGVEKQRAVGNWEAMLRRIATVKAIDVLRRRMRERDRMDQDTTPDSLAAKSGDPVELIGQLEQIEQLRATLTELPEQQATSLALRHLCGMTYEEMACEMGMTVNGVGVLLNRARANLVERMKASTYERQGES